MARTHESDENAPVLTPGELFPNKSAIELVRTSRDKLGLIRWHGEVLNQGPQVTHLGQQYAPIPIDPSTSRALRLPTGLAPAETTREVYEATDRLLKMYLHQPESSVTKLVFAVFASWISDLLPMAPVVWIVAPDGGPKYPTMQILSLICRRPLLLVGVSRGDFRRLPMWLQPTLILEEPRLNPAMLNLLRSSSRRGPNILSGGRVQSLYGSKIIISEKFPRDAWLASEALRVVLLPTTGRPQILDEKVQDEIAQEYQNRFFHYRLRSLPNVQSPEFDLSGLTPRAQDLARTLGAAVVGDTELQEEILSVLREQDGEFRSERSITVESVLLEALLHSDHEREKFEIRCLELAQTIDAIRSGRGDLQKPISPESVGWKLKALGIPSGSIGSAGNGVKLTDRNRRLIHQLAMQNDVRSLDDNLREGCRYCEELRRSAGSLE